MEVVLLVALILGFTANIVITRYLIKRIADKVSFLTNVPEVSIPSVATGTPVKTQATTTTATTRSPFDPASPNQLADDENAVEFNEQNFSSLPADVKLAVEGGDVHTPPGFEEVKEAKK